MRRRSEVLDVVLAAVLLAATQAEAWHGALSTHRQGPTAAAATAYLLAAAALVLRRRAPLLCVAVVCGVLALEFVLFGSPEGFAVMTLPMVAAYSVAEREELRRALVGLWLVLGLGVVWLLFDPMSTTLTQHLQGVMWFLPWVLAWLFGAYRRTRRLYVEQLVREREERAVVAVAEERARLARELHDVLGHSLSVMTVQASAVRRLMRPDQARERQALETVEATGRQALTEVRRLVGVLRRDGAAPDLAPPPSLAHLDRLVADFQQAGLAVAVEVEGDAVALPPGLDLTAYRLVQEALTNTLKHAGPTTTQVRLDYRDKALEVLVRDDGCGGPVVDGVGHGLIGMRERVAVYGGRLVAGPRAAGGFELRALLPLDEA
ncbi:MAG: sensor histidine kinase [Actinomycetes bacterium]